MSGKIRLLIAVLFTYPLCGVSAQGISDIIDRLQSVDCYQAEVDYQVLMSLQDDVRYTVGLTSKAVPSDTLIPCEYIIDWRVDSDNSSAHGFSAYFGGNAYAFRGERLVEYHFDREPQQFKNRGMGAASIPGVHRQALFISLLPQLIAEDLKTITTSPDYTYKFHSDTIVEGRRSKAVEAVMTMGGEVYREALYAFDYETMLPIFSEFENNPGALAEQTITGKYTYPEGAPSCASLSEENLRELYPEIFDKYRESNYAIENLPGQRIPAFALPTTTAERYAHHAGDSFRTPTLIVLIDPKSTFAEKTVESVRQGVASLPYNADIIWAFVSNNTDEIEAIIPHPEVGEHLLQSAKSLARDCGAASFPVIIFVEKDGTVKDVMVGFNNDMSNIVIEKALPMNR